jgi:excinuclease ABC subunit C
MQNSIRLSSKKINNLNFVPTEPGIYRFLDLDKQVIYIGKAKNLRKRVKSYFSKSKAKSKKLKRLRSESIFLEITITNTELEALLLEQHSIKELKPKYNVQFKDDKGYPWIKLSTSKEYPAAISFRGTKDTKDKYFGPFPSTFAVKNTLKIIQKIFKLRDCKDAFFKNRKRPCLQNEIGRCSAPCVKAISKKDYLKEVQQASSLLEGKTSDLLKVMYLEMDNYSSNKSYEKAADYRNKISSLREIQRDQSIAGYDKDKDAISISHSSERNRIGVTSVRGGWIVSHKNFTQENFSLKEGVLDSFLSSYYTTESTCPNVILVSEDLIDKQTIQIALSEYHNKKISITNKIRNKDIGLMKISQANTDLYLNRHKRNKKNLSKVLSSLKEKLDLKEAINLIESYDISHFSGKKALAGQITYNQTGKVKDLYRTYNISKENAGNDIGSMEEVIRRRFTKKGSEPALPSLVLIDGSYTHLKAVRKVLDRLSVEGVSLLAISKGARRKPEMDLIHTETGKKLSLRKNSPEFLLLQEIRDETHRFSISKQRKKELKGASKSSLDTIESVGFERKRALLRFFGSFDQISKASTKDLMKVKGVGKKTADIIFKILH